MDLGFPSFHLRLASVQGKAIAREIFLLFFPFFFQGRIWRRRRGNPALPLSSFFSLPSFF